MAFFWPKYTMLELKKSAEELSFIKLKSDAKSKGKLTCDLKLI